MAVVTSRINDAIKPRFSKEFFLETILQKFLRP